MDETYWRLAQNGMKTKKMNEALGTDSSDVLTRSVNKKLHGTE